MFKKSLLAAALLIAGGTAANAAEIGVRHTTGYTTRDITHGRFVAAGTSASRYTENSWGFNGGGAVGRGKGAGGASGYVRHERGGSLDGFKETYSFTGDSRSDFSEVTTFSR